MKNSLKNKLESKNIKNYADILDFATRGKLALPNANLVLFTKDHFSDQFLK